MKLLSIDFNLLSFDFNLLSIDFNLLSIEFKLLSSKRKNNLPSGLQLDTISVTPISIYHTIDVSGLLSMDYPLLEKLI